MARGTVSTFLRTSEFDAFFGLELAMMVVDECLNRAIAAETEVTGAGLRTGACLLLVLLCRDEARFQEVALRTGVLYLTVDFKQSNILVDAHQINNVRTS